MPTTLLLWLLYLGSVVFTGLAIRWLKRRLHLLVLVLLALVPIAFLLPGFTRGQTVLPVDHALLLPPWSGLVPGVERHNIFLNDIAMQVAPWAKAVRMAVKERALPLRNRWNGTSSPLAANGQSAAFSPFTILMFCLPLAKAFTLLVALKLFLTMVGTWLWLQEIGTSSEAAVFGALSFGLSLSITPWLLFTHTAVIAFWPWALFVLELLRHDATRRRAFVALVAIFVLWAVNGHPESAASGAVFAALWFGTRACMRALPDAVRLGRVALGAALLALGLTAFYLIPLISAIAASNRMVLAHRPFYADSFSFLPHKPAWVNGVFTPFLPRIFGDGVEAPMIDGGAGSFPEMALGYFGVVGWALLLLLLRPGPRPRIASSLIAPFVFGFGAAVGMWPFAEIVGTVPGLRQMFPLRFFSWVAIAGSALAAFELDRLSRDLAAKRHRVLIYVIASAASLSAYIAWIADRARGFHAPTAEAALNDGRDVALLTLGVSLVMVLLLGLLRRGRPLLPVGLAIVAGTELFAQGARLYRFGPPEYLFPPTPSIDFLRAQAGPFRVVGEGPVMFPNSNVFAELEDIRTHDPVEPRSYVEFLEHTAGYPPGEYFKQLTDVNASVLDFLNVRFLISPPWQRNPGLKWRLVYSGWDAAVFENPNVLPRAFAPRNVAVFPDASHVRPTAFRHEKPAAEVAALNETSGWASKAVVIVPIADAEIWRTSNQTGVRISDYRERTNSIFFTVTNEDPAQHAAVVTSLLQDGGWTARDGRGEPALTASANGPFLAVSVPPGSHRVELRYTPPGLLLGTAISTAAGAAGILIMMALLSGRHTARCGPSLEYGSAAGEGRKS